MNNGWFYFYLQEMQRLQHIMPQFGQSFRVVLEYFWTEAQSNAIGWASR